MTRPNGIVGIVPALALVGLLLGACGAADAPVEITIRHSRFEPATVRVPHGRPVTFLLRNDDPIDHEWIVGPAEIHEHHRAGTEPYHEGRPTEVSLPPLETRRTTVTFAEPVTVSFVCHLPGHEAYGMVGTLVVD